MTGKDLFDAVGGVEDELLVSDTRKKHGRKSWMRLGALAACLCLVVGGVYGALHMWRPGSSQYSSEYSSSSQVGSDFMSYAGPVFPLASLDDCSGLTAERNVTFDFSPYDDVTVVEEYEDGTTDTYERYYTKSLVTDQYVLTNQTDSDLTLTLAYPFAAGLTSQLEVVPTVTVDGETVETALYVGAYAGGFSPAIGDEESEETLNLEYPSSWEVYQALLEAGYMDTAFDEWPALDQPVVVYELSDFVVPENLDWETRNSVTLCMEFTIDFDTTTILTYNMNGSSSDTETGESGRSLFIPTEDSTRYGQSAYVIVLGDDLEDYVLQGYEDGGCDAGEELDGVSATVNRYETTLGEIFNTLGNLYLDEYESDTDVLEAEQTILDSASRSLTLGVAAELLCDYGVLSDDSAMRYDSGMLEDIYSEAISIQRVMYVTCTVTIPAQESVVLEASMVKNASYDYVGGGSDTKRNGYDLVTQLGSNLTFTRQTASLVNTGSIELLTDDFGFDLENGVTTVVLDLTQEHYSLEVQKVVQDQTQ